MLAIYNFRLLLGEPRNCSRDIAYFNSEGEYYYSATHPMIAESLCDH